jgi:pyruvate,water dikinase
VRSSATTEDLDEASFAGQQDTFLNVEGEENVLAAVKKCWASLFNARAIHYREKNNFKHDQAFLSVVIQKMVQAEKAGVMFTMNPVNKSKEEMIIEVCFGLGEKLVSGEITPDTFIIDKEQEKVKEEYLNFEKKTLTEKDVETLTQIGKKIESHYKKPMDIEWAIENKKVYILQARPITTM